MFGGEFLTSFVPEVGVQEQMREHGKDPLWKIKYEQHNLLLDEIYFQWGIYPVTERYVETQKPNV